MQRRKSNQIELRGNLTGYYIAIGIIIIGYIFLAIGDADSFTSRTLGPIIIVMGYIIAVPVSLLFGTVNTNKKNTTVSPGDDTAVDKPASKKTS